MHPEKIRDLLKGVQKGEVEIDAAMEDLKNLPFEDLGFAVVDHHRELRNSFAEVIFCQGKTPGQIVKIAESITSGGQNLLATRCDQQAAQALLDVLPEGHLPRAGQGRAAATGSRARNAWENRRALRWHR